MKIRTRCLTRQAGYVIPILADPYQLLGTCTQDLEENSVKTLMIVLFCFMLTTPLWAEEDLKETETEKPSNGAVFGGPVLKMTRINDVFGLMVGGRAGWIYKHRYAIGGGFYGLLRDIEVEVPYSSERGFEFSANGVEFEDSLEREFEFAYSGLELEYIAVPDRDIHLSAQTLVGFGGLTDRYQRTGPYYGYYGYDEYGRFGGPDDSFFIIEPQLSVVWNMKTYLQIYFGASYRYIRGVEIEGLDNSDLNGYSVVVVFRFGRNAKVEPPDQSEFEGVYIF